MFQQNSSELDQRIKKLEKTVFENGKDIVIFDLIEQRLNGLEDLLTTNYRENRYKIDILEQKITESVQKAQELSEKASVLLVRVENVVGRMDRIEKTQEITTASLSGRIDDLAQWSKQRIEEMIKSIGDIERVSRDG